MCQYKYRPINAKILNDNKVIVYSGIRVGCARAWPTLLFYKYLLYLTSCRALIMQGDLLTRGARELVRNFML